MKNLKYAAYALIGLGALLLLNGYMFYSMQLIDATKGIYTGPILLAVGIVLLLVSRK